MNFTVCGKVLVSFQMFYRVSTVAVETRDKEALSFAWISASMRFRLIRALKNNYWTQRISSIFIVL